MKSEDLTPGTQLPSMDHVFTTVELFLFSAASWHPHRVHFDQDYTREVEGHQNLLVHGPLQAVHLFQALTNQLPEGAQLTDARYRHLSPLYVGMPATLHGEVVGRDDDGGTIDVELWMENAESGKRTTQGTAVVQLVAS